MPLEAQFYRDISERKKREEMLRASEEDFTNLFEHVACGVFISSKQGKFLNANRHFWICWVMTIKPNFSKLISPRICMSGRRNAKIQEMIERDGRVIDYEVEFKRKDGSTVPVCSPVTPVMINRVMWSATKDSIWISPSGSYGTPAEGSS